MTIACFFRGHDLKWHLNVGNYAHYLCARCGKTMRVRR